MSSAEPLLNQLFDSVRCDEPLLLHARKTPFAHAPLHETPRDFSDAVAAEGRYFRFLFSLAPMQQNVSQATCRMVEHPTGVNKLLGCQGAFGPCPTGDSMPDSFHTPCV